jgi:integrase
MIRVHLKGVHSTSKRLRDGSRKRYWYAWKGGPRLLGEPGSPEFIASYEAAHARRRKPHPHAFRAIIADYKASRDFADLAARTRKDYLKHISSIEQEFGDMPISALDDPRVTRVFLDWRDNLPGGARQADYAFTVLTRILSWARDSGLTTWRPPARIKKLYHSDRSEAVWLPGDIGAFRAACSDELWLGLVLALETGQRQGDLLRLLWSAYDGETIRLRQGKTGQRVEIPVTPTLRAVLAATPRRCPQIMTNSRGRPWTPDGFRTVWRRACREAGITGLTFNDLRGSAVVRLAEAGCTVPEIASITGHSIRSAHGIIDRYLPRTRELALAAVAKLEKHKP